MTASRLDRRWWTAVLVVVLVVATTASAPAAAAEPASDQPGLIVTLHEDGSTVVTVQLTYDLTTEAEREAFRSLRNDSALHADAKERYRDRMERVATDVHQVTGRSVRVTDPSIAFETTADSETGIVRLSVTMDGLVDHRDEALVLEEPFASGFVADRDLVVRLPDGYAVERVRPTPDAQSDGVRTWEPDTDFDGFELVLSRTDRAGGQSAESTAATTPGFGAGLVALALIAGGLFLHRRNGP